MIADLLLLLLNHGQVDWSQQDYLLYVIKGGHLFVSANSCAFRESILAPEERRKPADGSPD